MPRVQELMCRGAKGTPVVAKCAVITDCTAAVITASPAVASASAADAWALGVPG